MFKNIAKSANCFIWVFSWCYVIKITYCLLQMKIMRPTQIWRTGFNMICFWRQNHLLSYFWYRLWILVVVGEFWSPQVVESEVLLLLQKWKYWTRYITTKIILDRGWLKWFENTIFCLNKWLDKVQLITNKKN